MLERVWRKGNPPTHCRWKCKLVQSLWRTVWRFLKKIKIELPYDPAIPLPGTYLEKTMVWKDTCTPMFIAALFIIARTWKQPKYPSTGEDVVYIYIYIYIYIYMHNGILLSHKKEWNNAIFSNMDGPRDYHTK